MFTFYWPYFALLLPLPLLIWWLWPLKPQHQTSLDDEESQPALIHPALERLEAAYAKAEPAMPKGLWLPLFLLSLLWVFLVLTLMQPQWLRPHTEMKSRGYDLMLAVDLSRSMLALDFSVRGNRVNRLQVVKGVMGTFIEQREGDRIGLILFGDGAYLQSPLTLDTRAVRKMLDATVPRLAGDGTAIGDAIALAVKKLRERPEGSRVLILLTDGENTAGSLPPNVATMLAAQHGIRIYTIGVGSEQETVPFPDESGQITMEAMSMDEGILQKIAQYSGGAYFRATDAKALEQIYEQINQLEKTEAESRTVWIPESLYRYPLGIALLLLLALAWNSRKRGQVSI
ncbi:vWA domain-containing protein [Candidatus Venteria ishoeyi]|uniref:von Willebrand factor type A domain protein n=1 Tax=Candidatus Venteria ishoeyi TaxID=1899563 RepID=A0A1H6FGE9_9GAMM|nr:VWA domain-containing protein [Candidatus Venteria ishoeyi]MDM8546475.1 VWA domain-containing protein [Candidatus Venteria ishoeyi]SEH08074.1 von Willebrand factor type A domain protein [Candidatus Venteria ishoeyi]